MRHGPRGAARVGCALRAKRSISSAQLSARRASGRAVRCARWACAADQARANQGAAQRWPAAAPSARGFGLSLPPRDVAAHGPTRTDAGAARDGAAGPARVRCIVCVRVEKLFALLSIPTAEKQIAHKETRILHRKAVASPPITRAPHRAETRAAPYPLGACRRSVHDR